MTGYAVGRILGMLAIPLLVMLIVGAVYYVVSGRRVTFRQALLRWWNIAIGVVVLLLGLFGQAMSSIPPR